MKNESAFPAGTETELNARVGQGENPQGMSKRFYAACKAMQAMMTDKLHPNENLIKDVVDDAFEIADEMIRQDEL